MFIFSLVLGGALGGELYLDMTDMVNWSKDPAISKAKFDALEAEIRTRIGTTCAEDEAAA